MKRKFMTRVLSLMLTVVMMTSLNAFAQTSNLQGENLMQTDADFMAAY